MINATNNFDLAERVHKSLFLDNSSNCTTFAGKMKVTKNLGTYLPEFLIFIEIYDVAGELILNYPVEKSTEKNLEEAMKIQVSRYGRLIENVCVCAVALEKSFVTDAEWLAYESFNGPEQLIIKTLNRAEKKATPENKQISILDLIEEIETSNSENDLLEAETKTPPPALCVNPQERHCEMV